MAFHLQLATSVARDQAAACGICFKRHDRLGVVDQIERLGCWEAIHGGSNGGGGGSAMRSGNRQRAAVGAPTKQQIDSSKGYPPPERK